MRRLVRKESVRADDGTETDADEDHSGGDHLLGVAAYVSSHE